MLFGAMDHLDISDHCTIAEHYESASQAPGALRQSWASTASTPPSTTARRSVAARAPSVFLAAAAQRTKHLRLGTLVYVLPAYHPVRLVEEIGMLDQLSGGRVDLGFGRGSVPMELAYLGIDPAEARRCMTRRWNASSRVCATSASISTASISTSTTLRIFQRPLQKPLPPIWYGVHSVESAEKAALRGLQYRLQRTCRGLGGLHRALQGDLEADATDQPMAKIGLARFVVVGPTERESGELASRAYAVFIKSFRFLHTRHGKVPASERPRSRPLTSWRPEDGASRARPERVVQVLRRQLRETGANYCVMRMAFGDMRFAEMAQSVELFAKHVAPALRERTAGSLETA